MLISLRINRAAPKPYCCLGNNARHQGLVGLHYNVNSGPIEITDSKTLRIKRFSFTGTQPPDGWILTGRGDVSKETGRKAGILQSDGTESFCPLLEDYNGDADLVVRLPQGQTIYDITYLSVYCYAFGVDFGHITFQLSPEQVPVPANIPPIYDSLAKIRQPEIC